MLGQKNTSHETLQSLSSSDDRWSSAQLFGKSANICGDLETIELAEAEKFKNLTGGEPIPAQFKNKQKFEYAPYAKLFFSCNHPPVIKDSALKEDLAFFERFNITYFRRRFESDEMDQSLVLEDRPEDSKLINSQEISGIFNVLLGILQRMRTDFTFGYEFNARRLNKFGSARFHRASRSTDSSNSFASRIQRTRFLPESSMKESIFGSEAKAAPRFHSRTSLADWEKCSAKSDRRTEPGKALAGKICRMRHFRRHFRSYSLPIPFHLEI
jgi:Family of unknown function (DUF5906)